MELTPVTKKELAKFIKRSAGIVTRLSNDGVFNACYTPNGKKIYLEKAIKAIIMTKGKDYVKDADLSSLEIDLSPPNEDETAELFTANNIEELQELLDLEPSPSKKIDMMDKFWSYKIRQQKFMELDGELITISDAKAVINQVFAPISTALDSTPMQLKATFNDIPIEAVEWLSDRMNMIKNEAKAVWNDYSTE